ncbi:hypothetical protein AT984_20830 [Paucibacter sp. KCTC 42545]|nr:hypothetical protein AT984_20830 [Paucibacter sp. KCTC 42545]
MLTAVIPIAIRAQEIPQNDGIGRAAGTKLERVEVNSRALSDVELRRQSKIAKQYFGREELDKYGDTTLPDLFKRLPGIDVQNGSPTLRGLSARYTQVLINGEPAPPGFSLDQMSPALVERIEIARTAVADQSTQAVAGTINIILKEAPSRAQNDLRATVEYYAEHPTTGFNYVWGQRKGGLSATLPLAYFEWHGIQNIRNERIMEGLDGNPSHAVQRGQAGFGGWFITAAPRLNWKLNDDETIGLNSYLRRIASYSHSSYANLILAGLPSLEDDSVGSGEGNTVNLNMSWNKVFTSERKLELKMGGLQTHSASQSSTFYRDTSTNELRPQRLSLGDVHERGLSQSGKLVELAGDAHTVSMGWDFDQRRREERRTVTERGILQTDSLEGESFAATLTRGAVYVQDEWEIAPFWSAYYGLRWEQIRTNSVLEVSTAPVRNTSAVLSPLLTLNYALDAKKRDIVRLSLARTYKAPELNQLLARPIINGLFPDITISNTELAPDRVGNSALRPELATGLDIAFEKYLSGSAFLSIGYFQREIRDLIRNVTTRMDVPYAKVPRWIAVPQNFSKAQTSGLEVEVKGRAGDLIPSLIDAKAPLNVRSALNLYWSKVDAVQLPNSRLENQQPWSALLSVDYRWQQVPLHAGATLTYRPGYAAQATPTTLYTTNLSRGFDLFAAWTINASSTLRFNARNIAPVETVTATYLPDGFQQSARLPSTIYGLSIELKL